MLKVFRRLFGRHDERQPQALKDRRVFAVGDIHGCDDLLEGMIAGMKLASAEDATPPLFIFLGDYVDRGPASRQVIQRLVSFSEEGNDARFLCGNHEEAMLGFLSDPETSMAWPGYGGKETMASYGVELPVDETNVMAWRATAARLKKAMPASHRRFLYSLEDSVELGDYFFVHAGIRPQRPLGKQTLRDLRWIREPFLSDDAPLERIVVHGHTPARRPYSDTRRIAIDTWAYHSGVLTAVELASEGGLRFLQARRTEAGVQVDWTSDAKHGV